MRFVFLLTVHKRQPFLPAKSDHFLKADGSHRSHTPGSHQQPQHQRCQQHDHDCLIAGIFPFLLTICISTALCRAAAAGIAVRCRSFAGRAAAARFAALGTSALVLPCALAGCTAGGRLFVSRCTAGCNRLLCPAAGQKLLCLTVIAGQLVFPEDRARVSIFQTFDGFVEQDRRLCRIGLVGGVGCFVAGRAHGVAGATGCTCWCFPADPEAFPHPFPGPAAHACRWWCPAAASCSCRKDPASGHSSPGFPAGAGQYGQAVRPDCWSRACAPSASAAGGG